MNTEGFGIVIRTMMSLHLKTDGWTESSSLLEEGYAVEEAWGQ